MKFVELIAAGVFAAAWVLAAQAIPTPPGVGQWAHSSWEQFLCPQRC
jgi:hypothetical protein